MLVALDVHLHVLRRHQLHLMAQRAQLTRPVGAPSHTLPARPHSLPLRTLIPLASANPRVVRLYDPAAASTAETRLAVLVASASLASAAKEVGRSARRSPTLCQTSRSRSVGGHATATYPSAICSSARRPCALRARDTYQVSKMSSQGVLRLLPLLTAHSTWQHLQSLEDKERSPSREASS